MHRRSFMGEIFAFFLRDLVTLRNAEVLWSHSLHPTIPHPQTLISLACPHARNENCRGFLVTDQVILLVEDFLSFLGCERRLKHLDKACWDAQFVV